MCAFLQKSYTPITGLKCSRMNAWDINNRNYATMRTQQPGSLPDYEVDPYQLLEDDLKDVYSYIKQVEEIIMTEVHI